MMKLSTGASLPAGRQDAGPGAQERDLHAGRVGVDCLGHLWRAPPPAMHHAWTVVCNTLWMRRRALSVICCCRNGARRGSSRAAAQQARTNSLNQSRQVPSVCAGFVLADCEARQRRRLSPQAGLSCRSQAAACDRSCECSSRPCFYAAKLRVHHLPVAGWVAAAPQLLLPAAHRAHARVREQTRSRMHSQCRQMVCSGGSSTLRSTGSFGQGRDLRPATTAGRPDGDCCSTKRARTQ